MKRIYISASLVLLFSGCATTDPRMSFEPPKYVEELPSRESEEDFSMMGSLYGQGENPLFSDRKAMKVNDTVTVSIKERAITSSSAKKKLSEGTNLALGGPGFTYGGKDDAIDGVVKKLNNISSFGAALNSNSKFDGTGQQSRDESFNTTVSARVIKILSNGNYFIDGSREIMIDGEKQIMRVSGVIRPIDIDQTNSIDSKYISDAKIYYETEGDIKKSTQKNWGTKVVESVWPF